MALYAWDANKGPNLLKGITDFLNKIKTLNAQISPDTIVVTMDAEFLYTNIPLDLDLYC